MAWRVWRDLGTFCELDYAALIFSRRTRDNLNTEPPGKDWTRERTTLLRWQIRTRQEYRLRRYTPVGSKDCSSKEGSSSSHVSEPLIAMTQWSRYSPAVLACNFTEDELKARFDSPDTGLRYQ